jgi:hypothetical protein
MGSACAADVFGQQSVGQVDNQAQIVRQLTGTPEIPEEICHTHPI